MSLSGNDKMKQKPLPQLLLSYIQRCSGYKLDLHYFTVDLNLCFEGYTKMLTCKSTMTYKSLGICITCQDVFQLLEGHQHSRIFRQRCVPYSSIVFPPHLASAIHPGGHFLGSSQTKDFCFSLHCPLQSKEDNYISFFLRLFSLQVLLQNVHYTYPRDIKIPGFFSIIFSLKPIITIQLCVQN